MLSDKVVIVTGGAGLLGKEFIKAIIENNGIGIIADIDQNSGQSAKEEISKQLGTENVDFVNLDISSKQSIQNVIDYVKNKYNRIDALVNNAYPRNKNYGRKFFEVEFKDFCENININLGGYFLISQQVSGFFKSQGFGNIVNIASIYGIIPPRFEIYEGTEMTTPVEYAVIKSGLLHLTKYMAKYFKGLNIKVNSLSPGGIFNDQPEIFIENYKKYSLTKGMLKATDLKGTLIYLLSDMSEYVNGQNIVVDDGFTL